MMKRIHSPQPLQKCVDGVTKSALLKQLAITDGENKFQEFLTITIRGTKKILVTAEYKKKKKKIEEKFTCFKQIFVISWWVFLSGGIPNGILKRNR